jgi:hypothetical protein
MSIFIVTNMSLICAAGALNPRAHYVSGMGIGELNALRTTFERMTDLDIVKRHYQRHKLFV